MAISSLGYLTQSKVPLDLEECSTQPVLMISVNSLKTLRFYKTQSREWKHFHDLTPAEAASLNVSLSDQPSSNVTKTLLELQEDHASIREQLDQIHFDMGLMNKKIDELIRLRSLLHRGLQLTIPMQPTDYAKAA